jgi:hypothetical protein
MRKLVLGITLAVAMGGSFSALAQETAAVDPSAPVPSIQPTVSVCETVSKNPELADAISGQCVTSTGAFIAALKGQPPAVAEQAIADLVVALAPLAQLGGPACDAYDDEIAAAIRMAATGSTNPEQVASLTEIAQTVDDCAVDQTAALIEEIPSSIN